MKRKVIQPSICLCERRNMFATMTRSSAEEMGYNLIRMHNVSGKLAVGMRNDHLVETLPGWITPPCLKHLQMNLSVILQKGVWYRHLSTIVRGSAKPLWYLRRHGVETSIICQNASINKWLGNAHDPRRCWTVTPSNPRSKSLLWDNNVRRLYHPDL